MPACDKNFNVEDTSRLAGTDAITKVKDDPEFISSYVNSCYLWLASGMTRDDVHDDFGLLGIAYCTDMMGLDIAIGGTWNWGLFDINHDYGAYNYRRSSQLWGFGYTLIKKANDLITMSNKIGEPKDANQKGYLGQGYALRAFTYMCLMQWFQDPVEGTTPNARFRNSAPGIPVIYSEKDAKSKEEAQKMLGRNTLADIKAEIERNLELALPLLKDYKRGSKNEINYEVAQGIAARYYLLTQQWDKAISAAKAAQNGYDLMDNVRLHSGFMEIEDNEVMWGFNHTVETQTGYASFFSHLSNDSPGYGGVGQSVHCIDRSLYDRIPSTDYRKTLFNDANGDSKGKWTGATLPYSSRKFGYATSWLQDYIYMRKAEMILIEAEAHARLADGQAKATLAQLMAMRDPAWSAVTVTVDDILLQRRIELWGEGFEYFDLRRNGLEVNRKYSNSNHYAQAQLKFPAHGKSWIFQIPRKEIQNNEYISESEQNEWVSGVTENN